MNKRLMTTLVIAVLALGLAGLAQERPVAPDKPGRAQMAPGRAPIQGRLESQRSGGRRRVLDHPGLGLGRQKAGDGPGDRRAGPGDPGDPDFPVTDGGGSLDRPFGRKGFLRTIV